MLIAWSKDELSHLREHLSGSVGFVPTMGALHDGHLSLVETARAQADSVAVSIFVNPAQFAPGEDFKSYPRTLKEDLITLGDVDLVYIPRIEDLYADGAVRDVAAGAPAQGLESDFRPDFFDGVCSVVKRLFDQISPDFAVFGEKDYQQLMVIRDLAERFDLNIDVIGAPTVRDDHGLALSSRNAYLSAHELEIARRMNAILRSGDATQRALRDAGFDRVDYVKTRWDRVLAAAWIGKTRLIDNVAV